jgi:uncharacterized protein YbcI
MPENPNQEPIVHDGSGAIVATISREIVGIYAEYFGRGPTKAKTTWREDLIVCILENAFTRAEHLLVDGGRFDQVRQNRQAFQDEIEPLFRQTIEKVTGRRVACCLSQINRDGIAAEIFILAGRAPAPSP